MKTGYIGLDEIDSGLRSGRSLTAPTRGADEQRNAASTAPSLSFDARDYSERRATLERRRTKATR